MNKKAPSIINAIFLVSGTSIGGGMLAQPVAASLIGFVPAIVMMFFSWLFMVSTALILLECYSNNLTSLDVSNNTALIELVSYSNQLTSLDVSNNSALTYLICGNNQLTTLDVRNGNNTNHIDFICNNNPLLYCIDVDNAAWSTANWTVGNNNIDPHHYFSEQCP